MDKIYALLGMLGNTGNDLIFKATAKHQEGRSIALFYLLQALFIMVCCLAAVWLLQLGSILHMTSLQFGLPIGVATYATYMLVPMNLVVSSVLAVSSILAIA